MDVQGQRHPTAMPSTFGNTEHFLRVVLDTSPALRPSRPHELGDSWDKGQTRGQGTDAPVTLLPNTWL